MPKRLEDNPKCSPSTIKYAFDSSILSYHYSALSSAFWSEFATEVKRGSLIIPSKTLIIYSRVGIVCESVGKLTEEKVWVTLAGSCNELAVSNFNVR
jgi:hypothetical protein